MLFPLVRLLVFMPCRDAPILAPIHLVPDDPAAFDERVKHLGKVNVVMRQAIELQRPWPPLKPPFPIRRRPQSCVSDAKRQSGRLLRLEQNLMSEEVWLDGSDARHPTPPLP